MTAPMSPNSSPMIGEDEVVPGVRKVEPAGQLGLPQAGTEDTPEPEGEEALDRVKAGSKRIRPGIDERPDARYLVLLQPHHEPRPDAHQAHGPELPEASSGDEEHRERRGSDDGRGAEVRLLEDKTHHRQRDEQERVSCRTGNP